MLHLVHITSARTRRYMSLRMIISSRKHAVAGSQRHITSTLCAWWRTLTSQNNRQNGALLTM